MDALLTKVAGKTTFTLPEVDGAVMERCGEGRGTLMLPRLSQRCFSKKALRSALLHTTLRNSPRSSIGELS